MKRWEWFSVFRELIHRNRLEQEMDEELQFHLDCQVRHNIKNGMTPQEARRTALLDFGGMPQVREDCRDSRGFRLLDELRQDLRYAMRQMMRNPGFTALAVLVLALGIGANTAVFSVIDLLIYRPIPVHQPERLVRNMDLLSYPNYLDIKRNSRTASAFSAASWWPLELWDSEYSEPFSGRAVSSDFFDVIGLKMPVGRSFVPEEDDVPAAHPVAIISYRLWQRRFGADSSAIGKTIRLNGEPLTIVGVAPKGFRDINYNGAYRDVWIPLSMFRPIQHLERDPIWSDVFEQRNKPFLMLVGRLNPGVSMQQAAARLKVIGAQLKKEYPESAKYFQSDLTWNIVLAQLSSPRTPDRGTLFSLNLLLAAAACILLICCANTGSLLLARASARQFEIATRFALGASRFRVVRQLLTECLVISASALAVSFVFWRTTLNCLPALEGSTLAEGPIGTMSDLDLMVESRTFVTAALIALIATVLFALLPALLGSRSGTGAILKNQRSLSCASPRLRRGLVVAQVTLSFILLIGAGLFLRIVYRFESVDPGLDENVLVVTAGKPFYDFDENKAMNYYRMADERIRALPGVRSAAWSHQVPPEAGEISGARPEPFTNENKFRTLYTSSISPGYFQTLRIPLIQGREFTAQDKGNPAEAVVVNETMARSYWPRSTPIGKRVQFQEGSRSYEVIGVVKDIGYSRAWNGSRPCAYLPLGMIGARMPKLHVSVFGDPNLMVSSIYRLFDSFGAEARVREIKPISAEVQSLLSKERSTAFVLAVFGGLALVLATVGLYGVVSYSVAQRSREFGIRVSLGARQGNIKMIVLREGIVTVLAGLVIGFPCSMALSRFLASRLHGISPLDPISYIGISLLWTLVSIAAALIPARKAITNPMAALRVE